MQESKRGPSRGSSRLMFSPRDDGAQHTMKYLSTSTNSPGTKEIAVRPILGESIAIEILFGYISGSVELGHVGLSLDLW